MNINELYKSISELNREIKYLVGKTQIDTYEDMSEIESDSSNPDDNQLMHELRDVMLHLSEISDTITFLKKSVKGEYVLYKNSKGRYECSEHEFTSGNVIEYLAYDEYSGHYRWVISRVEHNGSDYYIVGSQSLTYERRLIPMEGLHIRIRY